MKKMETSRSIFFYIGCKYIGCKQSKKSGVPVLEITLKELLRALFPGVSYDLLRRAVFNHDALVQKQHIVGHLSRKRHFVGHDYHRCLSFGKLADHPQNFAGKLRVESGWGSSKQYVRVQRKRTRYCHTLLLPPESWWG